MTNCSAASLPDFVPSPCGLGHREGNPVHCKRFHPRGDCKALSVVAKDEESDSETVATAARDPGRAKARGWAAGCFHPCWHIRKEAEKQSAQG